MGSQSIEPEELLQRIRTEHRSLQWAPLPPDPVQTGGTDVQGRSQESLAYLHKNWVLPTAIDDAGRPGLRGKLTGRLGRFVYSVLGPYFQAERELLANMVRVNDALEKRCDELTNRILELRHQMVDRQVSEARNQVELAVWLHRTLPDRNGQVDVGAPAAE